MAFPMGALAYPACLMSECGPAQRGSRERSRGEVRRDAKHLLSQRKHHSERKAGIRIQLPDRLALPSHLEKRSTSSTSVPTLTVSTIRADESLRSPLSAPDTKGHRTGPFSQGSKKDDKSGSTPQSAPGEINVALIPTSGPNNPSILYNHIHEVAAKRISTLDYLRKTHEGRVYWFNTFFFTRSDLVKIPYFDASKLGRRATNYLCLGLSIPAILDPNSENLNEYLRAFNSVMSEFESYQSLHPPDGTSSSFSRNKLPQMFKRATQGTGQKNRRGSSADAISPQNSNDDGSRYFNANPSQHTPFAGGNQELLPGEEYSFLLTPSLPFDPDYFETFATLCDVLIDCYTKIIALVVSPDVCGPSIGDQFSKVDARVRKILVAGVAKDFEEASRQGIKNEMAGIKKIVLGGLM